METTQDRKHTHGLNTQEDNQRRVRLIRHHRGDNEMKTGGKTNIRGELTEKNRTGNN